MRTPARRAAVAAIAGLALAVALPAAARPLMTRSEAVKLARAVNLTADDVPGFRASAPSQTAGVDLWGGRRYARCSGRKALGRALADVQANFERKTADGYEAIGSEVEVMPNAALVRKDIAIAKSARGRRCLLAELRATTPSDVKLVSAKLTPLKPGIKAGVALRLTLVLESQGVRFPFYTDVLVIGKENVETAVVFISTPNSGSRTDEDHYLNIVETRLDGQLYKDTIF
jgi:hypothetical protein